MERLMFVFAVLVLLTSCGNSSKSSNRYSDGSNGGTSSVLMVACPMCGGSGIFEFMPGDVMAPRQTCQGCQGNGLVTQETAQQIMQAKSQVDAMMNGGGNYNNGNRGRSAYEIEQDLRKAYELLEGMEYDYANCTSVVSKAQYPRMIADQKEQIRRLEMELRNAQ